MSLRPLATALRWHDTGSAGASPFGFAPGRKITGVLNRRAGSCGPVEELRATIEQQLIANGFSPALRLADPGDLRAQFAAAAAQGDILLAGGGDGTLRTAASVAMEASKPLLIVPLGTMNVLARDLGLATIGDALEGLEDPVVRRIDAASVNDHLFLNCLALGSFVGVTMARENLRAPRSSVRSWTDYCRELAKTLIGRGKRRLKWRELGGRIWHRSGALFVVNNPVSGAFPRLFERPRLDTGEVALYDMDSTNLVMTLTREWLRTGPARRAPVRTQFRRDIVLEFDSATVPAVIDGEVSLLENPVRISVLAGALDVLLPRRIAGQSSAANR